MNRRLQALGRLKKGERNKTEAKYEAHLERLMAAGEIQWFKFEAIKIRIGDNCFLTPDFAVMAADSTLELHDVKGSKHVFSDDARVKMRAAAELYPFRVKAVFPDKFNSWIIEEF